MATLRHWVQAARPLAQANLAAPLLLGQAFAYYATGRFDFRVLLALALWGVLDQLFIVFANDVADREHDEGGEAKTLFSGGSGVLPEGKLTASALLRGAFAAYALLGVLSLVLAAWRTPWAIAFWGAAGGLLWAYSFPPLRLSYRGGGELLQGVGVGVVLPLLGFAAQAGDLDAYPFPTLAATGLLALAGNVATALPDHAADRRADKRTWPVQMGRVRAAWACLGVTLAAIYLAIATSPARESRGALAFAVLPLLVALALDVRRRRHVLGFVFAQGLATQALWLGWTALLVWF